MSVSQYKERGMGKYYALCTGCIQNQIEILKYPFSEASERLSDKIIFKDQSKMK